MLGTFLVSWERCHFGLIVFVVDDGACAHKGSNFGACPCFLFSVGVLCVRALLFFFSKRCEHGVVVMLRSIAFQPQLVSLVVHGRRHGMEMTHFHRFKRTLNHVSSFGRRVAASHVLV